EQVPPLFKWPAAADRGEVPRGRVRVDREASIEQAVEADALGVEQRVLAVREADRVAVRLDDGERIDALPPEVAGIEVDADVGADLGPQAREAVGSEDRQPGMQLEADAQPGSSGRGPRRELAPEGHDVLAELPLPERLVVAAQPGHGEHASRVTRAAAARTPAHR